jgi:hypothetical protein
MAEVCEAALLTATDRESAWPTVATCEATAWTACHWNPSTSWSASTTRITDVDDRRLTGNQCLTREAYTRTAGP